MLDFRVKFYSELILDRGDNASLESDYLFRIGLSGIVHYDERLFFIYSSATASASLPAAAFNHPCSRHFDHSIRKIIMRNLIFSAKLSLGSLFDLLEMLSRNYRVLEETTCATHYRRVRKLFLAGLYDNPSDKRRGKRIRSCSCLNS